MYVDYCFSPMPARDSCTPKRGHTVTNSLLSNLNQQFVIEYIDTQLSSTDLGEIKMEKVERKSILEGYFILLSFMSFPLSDMYIHSTLLCNS